jgi:hypothetical protein
VTNPDDDVRDKLLRFLYERHKSSKGIGKIAIGIRDLQKEMKARFGLKQADVTSNLDYLIQVGWVREVVRERTFKTKRGMELSQEQVKYKISDIGINHLQAGTMFKRPDSFGSINITNVQGVTVVGEGNVVNANLTDLSRALDELDRAIGAAKELTDAQKLDAVGDLSTIRTQIAKQNPNKQIIKTAWESLQGLATVATLAEAAHKVGGIIAGLIGP